MGIKAKRVVTGVFWLAIVIIAVRLAVIVVPMFLDNTPHALTRAAFWCHDLNRFNTMTDTADLCRGWLMSIDDHERRVIAACDRTYYESDAGFKGCLISDGAAPPGA